MALLEPVMTRQPARQHARVEGLRAGSNQHSFQHGSVITSYSIHYTELYDSPFAVAERLDMVVVIHALYFTADVARFLRFAHDRLAPGGKVVIVVAEAGGRYSYNFV